VAIPTWNSAKTLGSALASLREQHDCHVEVVVADSGSTDGTLDLCRTLGVPTVFVPPGNMYAAINQGLRCLRAPWLAYLNSDDFVFTDAYARLISTAAVAGADVAYGDGDFVDAHGRFLYSLRAARPQALRSLFRVPFFGFMPHAAVFRRELFEALGGFDETFRHISDMEFFARACFAGSRFASVSYPSVAVFRIRQDQISSRERDIVRDEVGQLQSRWGERSGLLGRWAVLRWKVRNSREYLLRWLRTGSFTHAG
jgi:glycosyltransferase involved in cell wall biosynthesis